MIFSRFTSLFLFQTWCNAHLSFLLVLCEVWHPKPYNQLAGHLDQNHHANHLPKEIAGLIKGLSTTMIP